MRPPGSPARRQIDEFVWQGVNRAGTAARSVIVAPRTWPHIRADFTADVFMLRDGKYAAWFRTARGQGTGIVHLTEGLISGGDCFFAYGGSYRVDRNRFTAVLTVTRFADGAPGVFGPDQVEAILSGVCNGARATCAGTAPEAPGVTLEATLFLSQEDDALAVGARCAVVKLNADRLPKGIDSRSWPRHPFAPPKGTVS
jgi:hypothetical protein